MRSALDAVDAGLLVQRALEDADVLAPIQRAATLDVVAAGKAAAVMVNAFVAGTSVPVRHLLAIGPVRPSVLPEATAWITAAHPLPNAGSVAAARRALQIASASRREDLLIVLLSGGGSALMALPSGDVTLEQKQTTVRMLLEGGADIHELNTVRKHVSAIKGGQLGCAAGGSVLTLAVSDVVGDDLSVIASGPTVADDTTFAQALDVLARRGGHAQYPAAVVARLRDGAAGTVSETPKSGDQRLARSVARVIGSQRGAVETAKNRALSLGYDVHVVAAAVTGEARIAAIDHLARVQQVVASMRRPSCVISSGETTVTVTGAGRGGRNQEFALAMAGSLDRLGPRVAAASIGTDGIDGPTDAAGAIVDDSTLERARAADIDSPLRYLENNDSYAFFDRLGDLVRTGPTNTNVGDLQIVLIA